MPRLGKPIPLTLQEQSGDGTKFVKAVLKDPTGTPIAGSPFTLAHEANGLYKNFAVLMPDFDFVYAQFLVYDDAGFTILNTDIGITEEVFDRSFDLEAAIAVTAAVAVLAGGAKGFVKNESVVQKIGSDEVVGKIGED